MSATRKRAALLLEVVVALTIMVFALAMIGTQLVSGLRIVSDVDRQTRAIQFTDRMLGLLELDPEAIAQIGEEQQIDGDFGRQYPGWFWCATLEPIEGQEGLGLVTLEILAADDTTDESTSIADAKVVRAVRMLKAAPQPVDLVSDFGLSEEQAALFQETSPFPEIDPTALDPQLVAQLIQPETLMEILPVLMPLIAQMSGGQVPADISPDQLAGLLSGEVPFGPGAGGGGRGPGAGPGGEGGMIRDMIRGALGDQVSEAELDALMNDFQGGSGSDTGGRGARDLNDQRGVINQRLGVGGQRGGGRSPR